MNCYSRNRFIPLDCEFKHDLLDFYHSVHHVIARIISRAKIWVSKITIRILSQFLSCIYIILLQLIFIHQVDY